MCGSLCRRRGDELLVLSHIVAIVYFSQLEKNDDPWRESFIVFVVNIRGASKSSNVTLVSNIERNKVKKQNLIRGYIAFYGVVTRSRKISETRDTIPRSANRNASSSKLLLISKRSRK